MIVETDLFGTDCKKVIPSLDIAKFVFAVLVVMLHTAAFADISKNLNNVVSYYIARLAVPFFFTTSGYLCFRKTSYEAFDFEIPKRYALKILKLYIIWTIIYIIPFLYDSIYRCERGYMYGFFTVITTFVFSGYFHLWYLSALVVAVLLVGFALKKSFKIRTIIVIGTLLYMIGLLGQSYFFLLKPLKEFPMIWEALKLVEKVILTTRNGVFEGVIYVSIGMVFAYKKIIFNYMYAVIGFCFSMLLLSVEIFLTTSYELFYGQHYYIFLLPTTFFLFYLVIHFDVKQSKVTDSLRMYSMLIYYIHAWIDFPMIATINRMSKYITGKYQINFLTRFILVLGISILLSKVILYLSHKEKFSWIKNLY